MHAVVMISAIFFLTACSGPSPTGQHGAASNFEIGATDVAQSTLAWVGKAAKNMKDHWVMPQDATVQYVGGKAAARERARQDCVQQALFAAQSARHGNQQAARLAGSAGGRLGAPAMATSVSSSYMGAMRNNTWMDPLFRLGAAAATTAFTDNLQTVVDQATSECMTQRGYKPQQVAPTGY